MVNAMTYGGNHSIFVSDWNFVFDALKFETSVGIYICVYCYFFRLDDIVIRHLLLLIYCIKNRKGPLLSCDSSKFVALNYFYVVRQKTTFFQIFIYTSLHISIRFLTCFWNTKTQDFYRGKIHFLLHFR